MTESTGRHWSTDFVEHLRSVHFALIAISVGAIVLASARTQSEISRAHDQIKQMRTLVTSWDSKLLEHVLAARSHDAFTEAASGNTKDLRIDFPAGPKYIKAEFRGRHSFVTFNDKALETRFGEMHDLSLDQSLHRPDSVHDFQVIWDSLRAGVIVHKLEVFPDRCFLMGVNPNTPTKYSQVHCKWVEPSDTPNGRSAAMTFRMWGLFATEMMAKDFDSDLKVDSVYMGEGFKQRPVVLVPKPIQIEDADNLEIALINQHPEWNWQPGPFDKAFRELSSVSLDYRDLPLAQAEQIIADEVKRSGASSLDAFGMKFPAETAIRWGAGAFLILIVQLYLWTHLFEFRRKLGPEAEGWNVAWMGVYESQPARLLLYGSLVIFPLAGVLALGVRGLFISDFDWQSRVLLGATTTATSVLSGLICAALPRRKELVAEEPKPAKKSEAATV